jgi:hypothetical protein
MTYVSLGIDSNDNLYLCWTLSLSNISTRCFSRKVYTFHFGLRLIMVASLSLIPMDKIWGTYFSETIKGSVSKNGEIYFTGTTGTILQ